MNKSFVTPYSTEETNICFFCVYHSPERYTSIAEALVLHSLGNEFLVNDAIDGIRYDQTFELTDLMRPFGKGETFVRDKMGSFDYKQRNHCHLVLVGAEFPKEEDFSEGSHTILVHVKIESPFLYSRSEKYQDWSLVGCLSRLKNPRSISFKVFNTRELFQNSPYPHEGFSLVWKDTTRRWETTQAVRLVFMDNKILANQSCEICIGRIEMQISQEGIEEIRQKIGIPLGNEVDTYKEMLQLGSFADLKILCGGSKDCTGESNTVKCHQVFLAGISEVFGKMLGNLNQDEGMAVMVVKYSTNCMLALMHYAYHGGAQKIFAASFLEIIELLRAAKEYQMDKLLDFVTYVVTETPKRNNWFNLKGAFELFYFAANLYDDDEKIFKLRQKMVSIIQNCSLEEKNASHEYQNIVKVAKKCGPVFGLFLEAYAEPGDDYFPNCDVENLQDINANQVSKNEAKQLYEFLRCSQDYEFPRNPDVCIGIALLADYLGQEIEHCVTSIFGLYVAEEYKSSRYGKNNITDPNYFPALFELVASKSEKSWIWRHLAIIAARKMQGQNNAVLFASTKYKKLINDPILVALLRTLQQNVTTVKSSSV